MIGQLLDGKYELVRLIGESPSGAVYEALRSDDGQRVAVKIASDADPDAGTRFGREADLAGKLLSPHIVAILDRGHDEGLPGHYLVMELLEGEDAGLLLERLGPLAPDLVARIGVQAARGLADAHAAGLVHGQLTPKKIFIAREGDEVRVKLSDFGVAALETAATSGSSLRYMAPEVVEGRGTGDHRADLWSLGIVLHQLLSQRLPHHEIGDRDALVAAIARLPPPRVREAAPWVSEAMANVLAGALMLDPNERYPSATVFANRLLAAIGASAGNARITPDMLVAGSAPPRVSDRPPPMSTRRIPQRKAEDLDEATLARQREAQRAALASARLEVPGARPGMSNAKRIVLSLIAGAAFGGGGLVAYFRSLDAEAAPPRPAPIAAPEAPLAPGAQASNEDGVAAAGTEEPVQERAEDPADAAVEAPAEELEPAAPPRRLVIEPSFVGVLVNGKPLGPHEGSIMLEGEMGSRHNVVLTLRGQSRTFVVELTPGGPVPPRLYFAPAPVAPSSAEPGVPAPEPAPPTPPVPAPPRAPPESPGSSAPVDNSG